METEHIEFVDCEMAGSGTLDEKELIILLKSIPLSDREEAYRLATGYDGE